MSGFRCSIECLCMSDITRILSQIKSGDAAAAEQLLPMVYHELRKLAAANLNREKPGQTLQATALVHEAYMRLVLNRESVTSDSASAIANSEPAKWNTRGHFFGAAAEAMRRILVENARRKARVKHGGEFERLEIELGELPAAENSHNLLALDDALDRLAASDNQAAQLVKLRYFAGLTIPQAAESLGISPRSADSVWSFARAWLRREIESRE